MTKEQLDPQEDEVFLLALDWCTEKFGLSAGGQPKEPANPQQAALLAAISTDRRTKP